MQVEFKAKGQDLLWAKALWDKWEGEQLDFPLYSFAIVTDEPPKEIEEAGHDRCPVFIDYADQTSIQNLYHYELAYVDQKDRLDC